MSPLKTLIPFIALSLIIMLTSCLKDDEFLQQPNQQPADIVSRQYAQKLANPYTIENMTRAVDSIKIYDAMNGNFYTGVVQD